MTERKRQQLEAARESRSEKARNGTLKPYKPRETAIKSLCFPEDLEAALLKGLHWGGNYWAGKTPEIKEAELAGISALMMQVCIENPVQAGRLAIALLPKKVDISLEVARMTDDELYAEAAEIVRQAEIGPGGIEEAEIIE